MHKLEFLIAVMDALGICAIASFLLRWPHAHDAGPPILWGMLLTQMMADVARLFIFAMTLDLAAIYLARIFCGRHPSQIYRLVAAPFLGALMFSLAWAVIAFEGSLANTSRAIYYVHAAEREAVKVLFLVLGPMFVFELAVRLLMGLAIRARPTRHAAAPPQ